MPAARSIRRILLAGFVLLLLAAFVPPFFTLNRFRGRIAGAISGALDRAVTVSNVSLRLLPQPGFDLTNVVVQDDPAFSAEPMLRADEVTATLRLSSLWRGRLEIGSLSLKYPSLNLVRNPEGRWNIEALLSRAAQTPSAPTAKTRPEARPRFPYIEAGGGRINLKLGQEKKVYALSDSDFALWLASEDEWNMRLEARPVRTDFDLSDTGRIQLSGSFGRTASLRNTPMKVRLALQRAQLGQLTTLIYGRDRGWRGAVDLNATLAGTLADLTVSSDASVDDFRRYDIKSGEALRLSARCVARSQLASQTLSEIDCHLAQGKGDLAVRGAISGLSGARSYNLSIVAKDLPMSELARVARHVKLDLPDDLGATGALDAAFTFRSAPDSSAEVWAGGGSADDFALQSRVLGPELRIGHIEFAISGEGTAPDARRRLHGKSAASQSAAAARLLRETTVAVGPFTVALGGANPATARASLSRSQYQLEVRGDAEVQRLLNVAHALGLQAPRWTASGAARLDLQVAGGWARFAAPVSTGSVQLRDVTTQVMGVAQPLRVESANAAILAGEVQVQSLKASFKNSRMAWEGSLTLPRACDTPQPCPIHFDLHADQVATDELNLLLNPGLRQRPWYEIGVSQAGGSLGGLRAEGRLAADRVLIKSVAVNHVTAQVQLAGGDLRLMDLCGEIFGGKHCGAWHADFTTSPPSYAGSGTLEHAALAQTAAAMRDYWASGTLDGTYRATLSGWSAADLAQSATGSLQFEWRDGVLRHMALDAGARPLHLKRFAGQATLRAATLEFAPSKLETPDGIYVVSGTATLGRVLDLKLRGHNARGYAVSGSLEKPRVAALPAPATQAALAK